MLGARCANGSLVNRYGYRNRPSATLTYWTSFSLCPACIANLVPDARMAALALEHGLTLYSTDGDFARFPKLRWSNPLSP